MSKEIWAYVIKDGVKYPVHWWRPKPEHGDFCTDIAFVLSKAMKDGRKFEFKRVSELDENDR